MLQTALDVHFLLACSSEHAISLCIPRCIFLSFSPCIPHAFFLRSLTFSMRSLRKLCVPLWRSLFGRFPANFTVFSPWLYPLFQCCQINKQCFFGGEGVTIDEKGVFVQTSIIVSSKALVLLKCLNTFVHDCRQVRSLVGSLSYSLTRLFALYLVRSLSIPLCTDFAHTFPQCSPYIIRACFPAKSPMHSLRFPLFFKPLSS